MSAETKPAAAETAAAPEAADDQPAPITDLEGLKQLQAEIERQRAEAAQREAAARSIDHEAMKRLHNRMEARRQRAEAERIAAEEAKAAAAPKPQPEGQPEKPQTIREYLDSTPIKGANARLIELCQKHGISLDSPWPPQFPKEDEPMQKPQPPAPTAKVIQLDFWEDSRRAAPNVVFRSALFPALKFKEGRPFLKEKRIFTTKGGEVYFIGEQFDQSDLDVYLEILQFARPFPLGTPVRFSAYSMLKALGRANGYANHKWLHSVIIRLCGGVVDMTDHGKRYGGSLIHAFIKDEITKEYEVIIDPRYAALFGYGMWSTLDKAQRQALKQNQTAKALHAYYASHTAPGPHEYATLAEVAGLKDKNPRKVKMKIIAAHEAMKQIGFMPDYEAGATKIKATINHTTGQTQHVVKKIIKSRKAKKGTV